MAEEEATMVDEDNTDTTTDADSQEKTSEEEAKSADTPTDDAKASEEETAEDGDAAKSKDAKSEDDKSDKDEKSKDSESDEEDGDDEAEPISYDDLTAPEGVDVDETALGNFKELIGTFNEGKGLSTKDAQAVVDFRAEMIKAEVANWEQTFSEWRGEMHADKEIGGDNFKSKTIPNVLAACEKYGGAEMVKLIRTNKMYGEQPALIRLLNRVGAKHCVEDSLDRAKNPGKEQKDAASILYPDDEKEK